MIQFRGSNWGDALGRGIDSGMKIGGAIKQSMAESDYNSAREKADADYDTALKSAEELKTAGDEKGYQSALETAERNKRYAYQSALAGYHKGMGNIGEADAANLKLDQMKDRDDFFGKVKDNAAFYDKDIVSSLNNDFVARANGISYSLNDRGQLVMTQNGKAMGNAIDITDDMRQPYLQQMYAAHYDKKYGGAPTDASRAAWDKKTGALQTAMETARTQTETERHNKAMEDQYGARTAIHAASRNSKDSNKLKYVRVEGSNSDQEVFTDEGERLGMETYIMGKDGSPEKVFIPQGFEKEAFLKQKQAFHDLGAGYAVVSGEANGRPTVGLTVPGSSKVFSFNEYNRLLQDGKKANDARKAKEKADAREKEKQAIKTKYPLYTKYKEDKKERDKKIHADNLPRTALGGGK